MANPERGEVDLEVGGTRYRLALGVGGLRAIQREASTPGHRVTMVGVIDGAAAGDVEYLCLLVWGALQRHHPDLTHADVDRIIDDLGGLRALPILLEKITEMVQATAPDARDQGVQKKTPTPAPPPPLMTGTTGTASISRRARSA